MRFIFCIILESPEKIQSRKHDAYAETEASAKNSCVEQTPFGRSQKRKENLIFLTPSQHGLAKNLTVPNAAIFESGHLGTCLRHFL